MRVSDTTLLSLWFDINCMLSESSPTTLTLSFDTCKVFILDALPYHMHVNMLFILDDCSGLLIFQSIL